MISCFAFLQLSSFHWPRWHATYTILTICTESFSTSNSCHQVIVNIAFYWTQVGCVKVVLCTYVFTLFTWRTWFEPYIHLVLSTDFLDVYGFHLELEGEWLGRVERLSVGVLDGQDHLDVSLVVAHDLEPMLEFLINISQKWPKNGIFDSKH